MKRIEHFLLEVWFWQTWKKCHVFSLTDSFWHNESGGAWLLTSTRRRRTFDYHVLSGRRAILFYSILFYSLTKIKTAPYAMMKTCKHCFESKVSQIMFVSFSATICHYKVYMYNVHTLVLLSLFFSHHWFEELKGLINICRHQEWQKRSLLFFTAW